MWHGLPDGDTILMSGALGDRPDACDGILNGIISLRFWWLTSEQSLPNCDNIKGLDVMEFYVQLVSYLREKFFDLLCANLMKNHG